MTHKKGRERREGDQIVARTVTEDFDLIFMVDERKRERHGVGREKEISLFVQHVSQTTVA